MKLAKWSCMLVPLCLGCGTEHASLASRSTTPTPAVVAADVDAPSPVDGALETRGLMRVEADGHVSEPDWSNTRASLYILARTREGEAALVGNGAQLHTGEQIELHVSVGRPSYVYLIQVSPSQKAEILYPVQGESAHMLPGTDYRMPTDSHLRFELDANVGTERVVFVVAEQPLETGDADARLLIERLRQTGRWTEDADVTRRPSGTATAAPSGTSPVTLAAQPGPIHGAGALRGFLRATAGTGRALDVEVDQSGVSLAFFSFAHVP